LFFFGLNIEAASFSIFDTMPSGVCSKPGGVTARAWFRSVRELYCAVAPQIVHFVPNATFP
jgi:hypothetical protein